MRYPERERLFALLTCALLIFSLFAVMAEAEGLPGVSARSAALYEPETGRFIYRKNADLRLPMASTTKIMTAIVAVEHIDPETEICVDDRAIGVEGSSLYMETGERMTLSDLLYGLLLRSANDAALAIAYAVSGSVPEFAARMNEKAATIGLCDTHFDNPHGLDSEDHYTTANDLAILAAEFLRHPLLKEIAATGTAVIKNGDGLARRLVNHNKLLRLYDGAIGVKTGFTRKSGRCLVGAAERDGLTLISVTLDAPNDWNDHKTLLDLGFSRMESRLILKAGEYSLNLPVIGGTTDSVRVENTEEVRAILEKSAGEIRQEVRTHRYLAAPLSAGDIVGEIIFLSGDTVVAEVPIKIANDVPERPSGRRWGK